MLSQLPRDILFIICSYLPIRNIFLDVALINKIFNSHTKSAGLHTLLKKILFQNNITPLKQAKLIDLAFWGYATDGHCPNPEQWVDQLFTRTLFPKVIIQNCKYIDACLSEKAVEFRVQLYKLQKKVEQFCAVEAVNKISQVSIKNLYIASFKLSNEAFFLEDGQEKREIQQSIRYFWNRITNNQEIIQRKGEQLQTNKIAILRSIQIKIVNDRSQTPKEILFSTNNSLKCGKILRTNMIEHKEEAEFFDAKQRYYNFCIYQSPGPFLKIDLKSETLVGIHLTHMEAPLINQMRVNLLSFKQNNDGLPGTVFEYIHCRGYNIS